MDDQDAEAIIDERFPEAPDKAKRIQALKQRYDAWREKSMHVFSLPLLERRIELAKLLAGAETY